MVLPAPAGLLFQRLVGFDERLEQFVGVAVGCPELDYIEMVIQPESALSASHDNAVSPEPDCLPWRGAPKAQPDSSFWTAVSDTGSQHLHHL